MSNKVKPLSRKEVYNALADNAEKRAMIAMRRALDPRGEVYSIYELQHLIDCLAQEAKDLKEMLK